MRGGEGRLSWRVLLRSSFLALIERHHTRLGDNALLLHCTRDPRTLHLHHLHRSERRRQAASALCPRWMSETLSTASPTCDRPNEVADERGVGDENSSVEASTATGGEQPISARLTKPSHALSANKALTAVEHGGKQHNFCKGTLFTLSEVY